VYPQSVPNRLGTARDRPASSRIPRAPVGRLTGKSLCISSSNMTTRTGTATNTSSKSACVPLRTRRWSRCVSAPQETMGVCESSNTIHMNTVGGGSADVIRLLAMGRRRRLHLPLPLPASAATAAAATRLDPSATATAAAAATLPAGLLTPGPSYSLSLLVYQSPALIYLPPSSPEASNSRQPLIRKRKHDALAAALHLLLDEDREKRGDNSHTGYESTSCSIQPPIPFSAAFRTHTHRHRIRTRTPALHFWVICHQYIGYSKGVNTQRIAFASEHSFYPLCFLSVPFFFVSLFFLLPHSGLPVTIGSIIL
jgi:hypothetical protein